MDLIFRDTEAVRKITTVLNRNYEELLACSRVQPGELLREGEPCQAGGEPQAQAAGQAHCSNTQVGRAQLHNIVYLL